MSRLKLLSFIAVLAVTASPLAAQTSGSSGEGTNTLRGGQFNSQSSQSSQSQGSASGVICAEEMTGTFCNTVTSPSTGGYGASSSSVGSSTATPIPACGTLPPADELCN
jgi:hypothetical protein